jgi:hypothetical protein
VPSRLECGRRPMPNADLCLVRQVMQHLSNAEISRLLGKLKKYPYVIVAEHYPETEGMPNIDIVHGSNTRIEKHGSAVYLDKPPFSVSKVCLLSEVKLDYPPPMTGWLRIFYLSGNPRGQI